MRTLYFFLPLLLFTACQDDDDPIMPQEPDPELPVLTHLALGDSYTIGTGVEPEERWPAQLADALANPGNPADTAFNVRVDYVATNGWTTNELLAGLNAAENGLRAEYDLVSLLIGVNNQFRGQPVAAYPPDVRTLLDRAIGLAGGDTSRVFMVSIPDYAFTPFGGGREEISRDIDAYNAAGRAVAEEFGIPFLDITPISREGLDDPELVADDRLHPSGKQYGRWVEEVIRPLVR